MRRGKEHQSHDYEQYHCVDCEKDTNASGEHYYVVNDVWATSGLAPGGGMLCLACLERRIGRLLSKKDFTAVYQPAWERHLATRQLEMWAIVPDSGSRDK